MKKSSERYARYNAKSTKHYGIKLNLKTDAALIEKLESVDSINGYIRRLIREDIERTGSVKQPEDNAAESF